MATAIMTLVNKALEKVREVPISPAEFDTGIESHHMTCRRAVEDVLRDIFLVQKDEKLKSEFSFSTVPSQALYSLGFDGSLLASTDLRVLTFANDDYWLNYLAESEALEQYIDFNNLTQTGKPGEWWFQTGALPGDLKIRLNPIPDQIYIIKGYRYVAYSAVNSSTITPFSELGDSVVVDYVAAMLANQYFDETNTSEYMRKYESSLSKYLLENQNTDNVKNCALPVQYANEYEH